MKGKMHHPSAGRIKSIKPPTNPLKVGTKVPKSVTSKIGNLLSHLTSPKASSIIHTAYVRR